jgi:D-serine dehydratase
MENIQTLVARHPLVADLIALKETTWFNPGTTSIVEGLPYVGLTADVEEAHAALPVSHPGESIPGNGRWGIIESELVAIPACKSGSKAPSGSRLVAKCC